MEVIANREKRRIKFVKSPLTALNDYTNIPAREHKERLENYFKDGLIRDVYDYWWPAFVKATGMTEEEQKLVSIEWAKVEVNTTPTVFNNYCYNVVVKLKAPTYVADHELTNQPITIMQIPRLCDDYTVLWNQAHYAFKYILEQHEVVSFNEKANTDDSVLTIITGNAGISPKISFKKQAKSINFEFNRLTRRETGKPITLSAIQAVAGMAWNEGYDPVYLTSLLHENKVVDTYDIEMLQDLPNCVVGDSRFFKATDYINVLGPALLGIGENPRMNVDATSIRDTLNRTLSFNRCIGKTLARSVQYGPNPEDVIPAGSYINDDTVEKLNRGHVYCIQIANKALPGRFLYETIIIDIIPMGTKITPFLREFLPEEEKNHMYTSKEYNLQDYGTSIHIQKGTELDEDIVDLLWLTGLEKIKFLTSATSKKVHEMYIYRTVLNNRQFCEEHTIEGSEDVEKKWYYLNANDELVESPTGFTTWDLLAALQLFCEALDGDSSTILNVDESFRKRLITIEEQYHRAFIHACMEGGTKVRNTFSSKWKQDKGQFFLREFADNAYFPFTEAFFKYLRDRSKCITLLTANELTNILAYTSAISQINIATKNKNEISDSVRLVPIGSISRIDPHEVPQSGAIGAVMNLSCMARIDKDGNLLAPYRALHTVGDRIRVSSNVTWFKVEDEEDYVIGDCNSLTIDNKQFINEPKGTMVMAKVPQRGTAAKAIFKTVPISELQYITAYDVQTLSWCTCYLPDVGGSDANRVTFADAQVKAIKPIIEPDVPYWFTPLYTQLPTAVHTFGAISNREAKWASGRRRDEKTFDRGNDFYWQYNIDARTCVGDTDMKFQGDELPLQFVADSLADEAEAEVYRSSDLIIGANGLTTIYPAGGKRDREPVHKGDAILESNCIRDGVLSLGCNACVAYAIDGNEYEDSVEMSESLAHRMRSHRVNKEVWHQQIKEDREHPYYPKINSFVDYKMPGENVLSLAALHESAQVTPFTAEEAEGYIVKFETPSNPEVTGRGKLNTVIAKLVSESDVNVGDKIVNRCGNKGTVSAKVPMDECKLLTNGRPIDIMWNPVGAISRRNITQLKEISFGLFLHLLDIHCESPSFGGVTLEYIKNGVEFVYELANEDFDAACNKWVSYFGEDIIYFAQTRRDYIKSWRGVFDKQGMGYLILQNKHNTLTRSKALIGFAYVSKTIQESVVKLHGRSGYMECEPYLQITDAPTHGGARQGGQRYGNMEMFALMGYGASNLIMEALNERCDNSVKRNNMVVDKYLPDSLKEKYTIKGDAYRGSVYRFIYTMLALGIKVESDCGELPTIGAPIPPVFKPDILRGVNETTEKAVADATPTTTLEDLEKMFRSIGKGK